MTGRNRNDFTEQDDKHLIEYMATYNPETSGRLGNKLYERLEENVAGEWPWSENHPWQSWRERYKKNQEYFNYHIQKFMRKTKKAKEMGKHAKKKKDPSHTKPAKVPTTPKTAADKPSKSIQENESGFPDTESQENAHDHGAQSLHGGKEESDTFLKMETSRITRDDEQQKNDPKESDNSDIEIMSQNTMNELFGSYEDSERETSIDRIPVEESPVADALSNIQSRPRLPIPAVIAEGSSNHHVSPAKKTAPPRKAMKRKNEDDIFGTPPKSPSPHPITTKRDPPIRIEGKFHSILKSSRPDEGSNNQSPEWPPNRKRRKEDHIVQDIEVSREPVSNPKTVSSRPQQVHINAVASSSKVKLPEFIHTNPAQPTSLESGVRRDHHHFSIPRSLAPDTSSTDVPRESKAAQVANGVLTHHAVESSVVTVNGYRQQEQDLVPNMPGPPEEVVAPMVPHPTRIASHLKFNHAMPVGPSSDADPFIVSAKSVGKVRNDLPIDESKPPRRIDLHRKSLAKRLRPNTSLVSRPSSALSSRTSTSGSSKNGSSRHRTSDSLRQSLSSLDLPEETKDSFAVAATEDLAHLIETLAKQHGVSNEIAMKTYLNTRNVEKTKFVLNQFFQGLCALEQELFTRMPSLRYIPNGEVESDEDVLGGLIPHNESVQSSRRSSTSNLNHSHRQSTSSRKSKRPSLKIKPLRLDDERLSDYSPPGNSRAGQFIRLVKAGREEEAFAREQRRASGVYVPNSQFQRQVSFSPRDATPSPRGHAVPVDVSMDNEEPHVEDVDDDMDIYMHTEDEKQEEDEQEDDDVLEEQQEASAEEQEPELEVESDHEDEDDSGFVSASPVPSRQPSKKHESQEECADTWDSEMADKIRTLALNVTARSSDEMRKLEAVHECGRLRLASLQWIVDSLASFENTWVKQEEGTS